MKIKITDEEFKEFKLESQELLDKAESSLLAIDKGEPFQSHYDAIFRAFHTIKGVAGMMEMTDLQNHLHQLESLLTQLKTEKTLEHAQTDLFLRGCDATRQMLDGKKIDFSYDTKDQVEKPAEQPNSETQLALNEFFAECEDILGRIAKNIEIFARDGMSPAVIDSLYRDVHTLKGSALLFGFQDIGDLGHALESCLDPIRRGLAPSAEFSDTLYGSVDLFEVMLATYKSGAKKDWTTEIKNTLVQMAKASADAIQSDANLQKEFNQILEKFGVKNGAPSQNEAIAKVKEPAGAPVEASHSDPSGTIRVPVILLDKLMTMMGEMVLVRNQVLQYSNDSDDLEFLNLSQRLDVVTSEIQGEVMKTRMQPIGNVLSKFQRVVRDLAKELNKKIELSLFGIETELDKTLLEAIKDPLVHIVRNSCDHGIEMPDERRQAGKPEGGRVSIRAFHEGGQVIIEIADDGRGLATEKILNKAIEKGLVSADKASSLSEREVLALIFAPGLTTAKQVTNVSGRGVGMDVVKSNIEKIGGMIDISSQPGKGMTLRLKIPLTLAIVPAMIIRSGTDRYAIPQVKLVELVRAERNKTEHQIEYLQGKPVYRLRGNLLPLIDLREVLGVSDPKIEKSVATLPDCVNIVVLNAERQIFGLMVDEILDTADIVVKPLSRFLKTLSVYSGATVLGDGSVALILDVLGVAQRQLLATESGNGSSMANEEKDESGLWNEEQEFLLFRLNSQAKHAIPLSLVHRLEEFKASDIEYSGGQRVVRYRGTILPIVSLNDFLNYPAPENEIKRDIMPVIVSQKGSRLFGIEVNEILDVTSTSHGLDDSLSDRKGILGNIMSSQGIIVLVDTLQILSTALERLSHSVSVDKTQVTKKAQNRRGHILFAEDTVFFRKHVGKVLENAGYDLSYAVNGESALDILNETSSSVPFDLILSDIEMPKMNGLELAKAIRKDTRLKHLPMIALTTRFNDHYAQEGIAAGFNLYLEKMNAEQLIKAIESLLKEKLEMEVA